ncbi:MAG: hypothetical protein K5656_07940, partial [Lachnospiraceae bacterium]|nr:hypothetical protein [Lachnospiraceae bacterium]
MNKNIRIIVVGFLFVFVLSVLVFLGLNHYMDGQTEKDVRDIAQVHLQGMAEEMNDRCEAIKTVRFSQVASLKRSVERLGREPSSDAVKAAVSSAADFQSLTSAVLVSNSGAMWTVVGNPIEKLGDSDYLLTSLQNGKEVVT